MKKINISRGKGAEKTAIAYISINGSTIRKNAVTGSRDAPIRIGKSQSDSKPVYAHEITIVGPSQLIYSPDEPIIRCGARLALVAAYDDVRIVR